MEGKTTWSAQKIKFCDNNFNSKIMVCLRMAPYGYRKTKSNDHVIDMKSIFYRNHENYWQTIVLFTSKGNELPECGSYTRMIAISTGLKVCVFGQIPPPHLGHNFSVFDNCTQRYTLAKV